MATPAQINANRANAQKSTGPRSAEGKSASRFNALKHGIDAASIVIPGEDPADYDALAAAYHHDFRPESASETFHVDTMLRADWQKRRLQRVEADLHRTILAELPAPPSPPPSSPTPPPPNSSPACSARSPPSNAPGTAPIPNSAAPASRPKPPRTRPWIVTSTACSVPAPELASLHQSANTTSRPQPAPASTPNWPPTDEKTGRPCILRRLICPCAAVVNRDPIGNRPGQAARTVLLRQQHAEQGLGGAVELLLACGARSPPAAPGPGACSGTATSRPCAISACIVRAGRMLMPEPSATASLIIWILSKCIARLTSMPCARKKRSSSRRMRRSSSKPMKSWPLRSAGIDFRAGGQRVGGRHRHLHLLLAPRNRRDLAARFRIAHQAQVRRIVAHRVVDLVRTHVLHVQLRGGISRGEFLLQPGHLGKAHRSRSRPRAPCPPPRPSAIPARG